jgi:hypothetical protein
MVRINPWKSYNPSSGHCLIDIGTIQQLDFGAPVKLYAQKHIGDTNFKVKIFHRQKITRMQF